MRRLVLGLGLGGMAVVAAMVGWWLFRTHGETLEGGVASARATAQASAAYTARLLQSIDETNREIGTWFELGMPPPLIDKLLRQTKDASPFLMDVLVLDAAGRIEHWSGVGAKPQVSDRPYFQAHSGTSPRSWFIDEARASRVHLGRWFFSFSRVVKGADGQVERIIVAILDAAYFDDMLATLAARSDTHAMLVHANGKVIAASFDDSVRGRGLTDPAAVTEGGRRLDDDDDVGWRQAVDAFPLQIAVRLDRAKVLEPWKQRVAVSLVALALGGGVIVALCLLLVRKIDQMAQTERRYRALVEQSLVGIFFTHGGHIGYVNPRFAEILGFAAPAQLRGRAFLDLVAEADRARVMAHLARWSAEGEMVHPVVFMASRADGVSVELEAQGRMVDIEGEPAVLGVLSDVTEKQRAERQLQYLAFHDPLTQLPNRSLCFDRLSQAIYRGRREGTVFAVMAIDLDGFKAVNDTYGHDAGDAVLCAVARRLQDCVRESDTVARTGGDEFVMVVHGVRGHDDARAVAGKIVSTLAQPVGLSDGVAKVGASVGVVVFPADGVEMESLVSRADAAMYAAKAAGKDGYRFFEEKLVAQPSSFSGRVEWNPERLTGIGIIDEQHQHLAALVSAMARGLDQGEDMGRLRALSDDLLHFARFHFETEERLMDEHFAPQADGHKREHRRLIDELESVLEGMERRSAAGTFSLAMDWLLIHMAHADHALGQYLASRGVK